MLRKPRPDLSGREVDAQPTVRFPRVPAVLSVLFGTEIADQRALWGFVIRVSVLVTVAAQILNLLSLLLFPEPWGFERFAIQTFVIAFGTAIPSTYFVGWTGMQLTRAKEDLRVLSRTDGLTGLPNRLAFQEILGRGDGEALAIVDIDHFKDVNDTFGHPVGDEVIQELGRRLASLQPDIFVARIGGEEFACIANSGAATELGAQLEHIRSELAGRPLSIGHFRVQVTLSAGLAERAGRTSHVFYGAADRTLYLAKRQGRNVVLSENDATSNTGSSGANRPAA